MTVPKMIEILIRHLETEEELGRITIENVGGDETHSDYSIRFATDRIGAIGVQQRAIYAFPRIKYNVLALLLQALNTLEPPELELRDGTSASDLAGRFSGTGKSVQRRKSKLHRDGPSFWGR